MPPISKVLPFNPVEDMTTTQTSTTEQATGTSATADPHGHSATADSHGHETEACEMDLDLGLRQDRRDLRAAMAVFRREDRAEAITRYNDMMALVTSLGHSGRKFRREATNRLRAIVSKYIPHPGSLRQQRGNPDWELCLESRSTHVD